MPVHSNTYISESWLPHGLIIVIGQMMRMPLWMPWGFTMSLPLLIIYYFYITVKNCKKATYVIDCGK